MEGGVRQFGKGVDELTLKHGTIKQFDGVLLWHGEGILQCFQSLLEGQAMRDLLRNAEHIDPPGVQGLEVLFKLVGQHLGATGARLIKLADSILSPNRAKMADVRASSTALRGVCWSASGEARRYSMAAVSVKNEKKATSSQESNRKPLRLVNDNINEGVE